MKLSMANIVKARETNYVVERTCNMKINLKETGNKEI